MTQNPDGNALVIYLENGAPIGTRLQYCCGYANSAGDRHSALWPHTAYFCPVCGEIWARVIYDYQFNYVPLVPVSWSIESRRCASHGDGTLLTGYEGEHLRSCSPELLSREALILCLRNPNGPLNFN